MDQTQVMDQEENPVQLVSFADHGKSTLADRLLELTRTIPAVKNGERNSQILDTLKVERERGITVRAMSVS